MGVKFSNNASSRLSGSITSSATTLAVEDASGFPALAAGEWFPATIVDSLANREIVKVTARSGATFTIVRGQEATLARSFASGSRIDLRATAASLQALVTDAVDAEAATRAAAIAAESDARAGAIADEAAARSNADSVRLKFFAAGAPLPTTNIGPIWHDDYNDIMTWQVFNAAGANYTGYASRDIGKPSTENASTPRKGTIKRNGASLSKTTYAALYNWALHNGLFVSLGSWAPGTNVYADNGDGTFKVPDVRGEHMRFWDDGRGVDSGRGLGSWQDSQNKSHNHVVNDPTHSHSTTGAIQVNNGSQIQSGNGYSYTGSTVNAASTGISLQFSGGTEARVRNVSELAVLKF